MKASIVLFVISALFVACARPTDIAAAGKLNLKDAERIMGEPSHLTDSSTKRVADAVNCYFAYNADKEDAKSLKTGALYFLLEDYDQVAGARKRYTFIKEANEHNGIKVLNDVGDEAYFHSDNVNFYYIMVRKGKRVFNMKVNKITSNTSLEEFNRIARKIAATM